MGYGRWCIISCLLLLATPVRADDPHPPQLTVTFLAQPAPIVQDGSTRLYYEMVITSFAKDSYSLDAVEAKAGATKARFDGQSLAAFILRPGAVRFGTLLSFGWSRLPRCALGFKTRETVHGDREISDHAESSA